MKAALILALAVIAAVSARPEDKYTDKYDNINVDEILANKRLLTPYMKCVLDQGKCSPEGRELKSHIKEALETFCEKCTEVQREKTRQVLSHLINKEADYWNQLQQKYDPAKKYTVRYENELKQLKA